MSYNSKITIAVGLVSENDTTPFSIVPKFIFIVQSSIVTPIFVMGKRKGKAIGIASENSAALPVSKIPNFLLNINPRIRLVSKLDTAFSIAPSVLCDD